LLDFLCRTTSADFDVARTPAEGSHGRPVFRARPGEHIADEFEFTEPAQLIEGCRPAGKVLSSLLGDVVAELVNDFESAGHSKGASDSPVEVAHRVDRVAARSDEDVEGRFDLVGGNHAARRDHEVLRDQLDDVTKISPLTESSDLRYLQERRIGDGEARSSSLHRPDAGVESVDIASSVRMSGVRLRKPDPVIDVEVDQARRSSGSEER